jgi:predicted GTPase
VYAGVDYEAILRAAEGEADVVLWDGGNNDLPFFAPNLHIVVADPLRAGHELRYHPGEANLRAADVVVINKVDEAKPDSVIALHATIADVNPRAAVVDARSALSLDRPIEGRTVAVVEDGPTLTHGEMTYGAGIVAARRFGATPIDPRPYAVGGLADVLARYPRLEALLPAMGYGATQVGELEATLNAIPADLVLSATPIDLTRIMKLTKPVVRVRYELDEVEPGALRGLLEPIVAMASASDRAPARS